MFARVTIVETNSVCDFESGKAVEVITTMEKPVVRKVQWRLLAEGASSRRTTRGDDSSLLVLRVDVDED